MKKLIVIIIAAAFSFSASQSKEFVFERFSLEQGLSQSSVTAIYQDSKGFLWFATGNGLNKYDGYSFKIYKHNSKNSYSLSNDMINGITEDNEGNLWVSTEDGLNKFNPQREKFTRYKNEEGENHLSYNRINPVYADNEGAVWIGTLGGGLNKYSYNKFSFPVYFENEENESANYITDIFEDSKGILWIGSYGGLIKLNKNSGSYKLYENFPEVKENPAGKRVFSILEDNEFLWLGTGNGLVKFDPISEEFISFNTKNSGISGNAISSLLIDSKNNFWIGTNGGGLNLFDRRDGKFIQIKYNPLVQTSLSENSVTSIFEDHSGIIWIGTMYSGLNKLAASKNKFEVFRNDPENKNSLISNNISEIYKDSRGILWIGTRDGLCSFDKKSGRWRRDYSINNSEIKVIYSIIEDENKNLWFCGYNGLYRYNRISNSFTLIIPPGESAPMNVTAIILDPDGSIWLNSARSGIFKYNLELNNFTKLTKEASGGKRIFALHIDKKNTLWLGSQAGLIKYSINTKEKKEYMHSPDDPGSLSANLIQSIYEDEEENLWLGTYGGGLNKFIKNAERFIQYSEDEGLPNNVVYAALPDKNGSLWLSTNKGLCRFNPMNGAVTNFDMADGIQSYEFNGGAYFKSSDGEMFFGGINGFNSFYPELVTSNPSIPKIVITSVKKIDEKILTDINKGYNSQLEFSHNENIISFEFVSLDFTNPKKNRYAYKLDGFDKDWINSDGRRFARYTNLEPGSYTFKIKGSNNDNIWNEKGASVSFIIHPPFWNTWWFYTLTGIIILAAAASVHKYRVRSKLKRIVEIEKLRKEIADDFHDELGHKLTKISMYSELLKRNLDGRLNGNEEYLVKINENANTLYDDTKDFIWSIDPAKDTLYHLAVYLKDFGDEIFDKTGIAFRVNEISIELEKFNLAMDWKRQLILIFKEAMNNIIRHSGAKNVFLSVYAEDEYIFFKLIDDGRGISGEKGGSGRGINNIKSRAKKIGGEVFISSDETGTEILFKGTALKESKK